MACLLHAQPVLTGAGNNPIAGDAFARHTCGVTAVSLGTTGPGVSWDFSALSTISIDTIRYQACNTTPECDSFPGSTLAVDLAGFYSYYITDSNRIALSGHATGSANTYYTIPENNMVYPMHYLDIKAATFASHQPSTTSYEYGIDSFIADAYGSLLLPTGSYSNVLRIHEIANYTDSNILTTGAVVSSYRRDTYFWYTSNFRSPLLALYYDLDPHGIPELAQVYYYSQTATNIGTTNQPDNSICVYPNPAHEQLSIQLDLFSAGEVKLSVTDMAGREICKPTSTFLTRGQHTIHYPISTISAGVYFLKCQANNLVAHTRFVVK